MLKHRRVYALVLVAAIVASAGAAAWTVRNIANSPRDAGPPGLVAEAAGLFVTYDPARSGLTVLIAESPAGQAGASRAAPAWREVLSLEPRALVNGVWETPSAPAAQPRRPTLAVRQEHDSVDVHLDGLEVGDLMRSSWTLKLSRTAPSLTLDRVDTLLRAQSVTGGGLVVASAPNATPDRLVLVNGTAYTLSDKPIDRMGNHGWNGLVHRDPALTFAFSAPEMARARGERAGDRDLILIGADRPAGGGVIVKSSISLHIGESDALQQGFSSFNPATEAFLLTAGYYGNVFVSQANGRVLTASMLVYPDSVWIRDVAMATRAYGHVLDDMKAVRNTLTQFLARTGADGVVPEYFNEAGQAENRQAWDAMPDLIHGAYAYVSKTRDVAFVNDHLETLIRAREWIRRLDTDDDGLPDRDIYPYGYYDSVENGVMHTYAIASFYCAHIELAELAELAGRDGAPYRAYAERMRAAFNRPLAEGGYWQPDRGYPIAWKKADGRIVRDFETFGVLAAVRWGLITDDGRLREIGTVLRNQRNEFTNENAFPSRLMLGGYDWSVARVGVGQEQGWMLDANAPWVVGHDVAVRARLGAFDDAAYILESYETATAHYPPMAEFGAAAGARHGPGVSRDGGRLWDNSAWFDAVYGTHYGVRMTPRALMLQPNPLRTLPDDAAELTYQGMRFRISPRLDGYTVTVLEGATRDVVMLPCGGFGSVTVNGWAAQAAQKVTARPGEQYVVQCFARVGG